MAVLSKIRQRSLLLIGVIGFCLLAFLIGDIFTSGNLNLASKDVGSVNGKDITFEDFRVKVANVEKSGQGISAAQAASRVWDQEIAIALLTTEFDKLGIRVSDKHILEAFKNDPQIGQNQMFKGANGEFDVNKLSEFIKTNPDAAQAIKEREKDAILNAKYLIYNSLVKGGVFVTEAEGKFKYEAETTKATFDYVGVLFSTIKDSDVKISDSELVDYMKKHEKRYKSEENRELEYVLVADKPSAQDEAEVKERVDKLLTSTDSTGNFRTVKNIGDFVNNNSDIPFDTTYIAKKDLPTAHADALFNLPVGQIYGPYTQGNYYAVSRAMGRKAGANAKASHILISWEGTQVPNKREKRTKEEAKAKAEALLAQAKANPAGFAMLAITNSDDSSANQGGDLGYFGPNQMVKPFNDFVFKNPIGTIGLVETEYGYHVINVTDKQDAVKLATIAQKIEASDATTDALYQKAVKVEMEANDKDFAAVAKAEKLEVVPSVKVKAMDEYFGQIGAQRAIVQWAFNKDTEVGNVKRFEIVNVGNVIVKLKKINKEGLLSIEEARVSVEPLLKNKKKAEMITKKMSGASLQAIAQASGATVQSAADLTLENAMIPNAGPEPKVVGTAIATAVGKVSKPVEGNSGVYVVSTKSVVKAPAIKDHLDFVNKVKTTTASYSSRVIPALKADAKIEDNRARFNY